MKKPPALYPPPAKLSAFDLDTSRPGLIAEGYHRRFTSNGFKVIELDVEADPAKRDPEWLAREQRRIKNPKAFRQEYKRDWTVGTGDDFYPEFSAYYPEVIAEDGLRERPGVVYSFPRVVRGLPIDRGWDFGYRHPAVIWTQYSPEAHRLYVLREVMPADIDIGPFADLVLYLSGQLRREELHGPRLLRELLRIEQAAEEGKLPKPPWFTSTPTSPLSFRDFSGPEALQVTGTNPTEVKERTDADILAGKGIHLNWLVVSVSAREGIVRDLLRPRDDGYSGMLIDPFCSITIAGFGGGLVYKEPTKENPEPSEPRKDGVYEHLHDALGYVATQVVPKVRPVVKKPGSRVLPKGTVRAAAESRPNRLELSTASRKLKYDQTRDEALAALDGTEDNYLD